MNEDRAVARLTLERAVERVRAAAMDMRATGDLRQVVAVLFDEMRDLGVEAPAASIWFVEETTDEVARYHATLSPVAVGIDWSPDRCPEPGHVTLVGDTLTLGGATGKSVDHFLNSSDAWQAAWRNGERHTYEDAWNPESLGERFGLNADENRRYRERWQGRWFVTNVPFRFGMIGYRERQHDPEHDDLVAELARGLELGFVRFLDFQQLERQNRELEVERGLERVRTAVAGMEGSGDLAGIVEVVRQELTGLAVPCLNVAITAYDPERRRFAASFHGGSDNVAAWSISWDADERPELLDHFTRGQTWVCLHSREEMDRDLIAERERRQLSPQQLEEWAAWSEIWPEGRWTVEAFFDRGGLSMNKPAPEAFTDDDVSLLERFTGVFAVGYRRHLDLAAAEERARQAEIERAVERVRGAVEAMRASADLAELSGVLSGALRDLGVPVRGLGVNIVDETTRSMAVYNQRIDMPDTTEMGSAEPEYFDRWQAGGAWQRLWDAETSRRRVEQIEASLGREPTPEERRLADRMSQKDRWVVDAFFSHGAVAVDKPGPEPFSDDNLAVLQRLTEVFGVGYRRHLELAEAEQRARALEVERALERVRTAVAGMDSSDGLGDLRHRVLGELQSLGVPCADVGIVTYDATRQELSFTGQQPYHYDHGRRLLGKETPFAVEMVPSAHDWADHWDRRETFARARRREEIEADVRGLVTAGAASDTEARDLRERWLSSGERWIVDAYFEHGSLAMNKPLPEPFSGADIRLLERFTEVFALGYRRHLDLAAAEARAREANLSRARQQVRSVVSSMERPEDIERVVVLLRDELRDLNVACDQVGINIVDAETGTIRASWSSSVGSDTDVTRGGSQAQSASNQRLLDIWRSGEVWNRARSETNLDDLGWVVDVPFQYGTVAMNRGQTDADVAAFADDEIAVLQSFVEVLSLGYTRFFDIQQLEEQNRQLAVERALQQVRAEVASMAESDDIGRVMGVIYAEMRTLGVPVDSANIIVVEEELERTRQYVLIAREPFGAGFTGEPVVVDVVDGVDLYRGDRPKRAGDWVDDSARGPSIGKLAYTLEEWEAQRGVYREQFGFDVDFELRHRHQMSVPFSHGWLLFFTRSPEPFDPAHLDVAVEFARMLSLGYARYLDFERLEAQNRELTIERAVERVRAEASAMTKPGDIGRLFVALWEGADQVGCPRPGMNIVDEERREFFVFAWWGDDELYLLELDSDVQLVARDFLPGMHLVRGNILPLSLAHEQGWAAPGMEPRITPMADDFPQAMQLLWGYYNPAWEGVIGVPVVNVPFAYGGLFGFARSAPNSEGITRGDPGQPTEEDLRLLERFAGAVSFGYGRYLELIAAEERNRQLILDRAVERVRAEATAMRESTDIGKVLYALGEGWTEVGLSVSGSGINIVDEKSETFHTFWLHRLEQLPERLERRIVSRDVAPGIHVCRSLDAPLDLAREWGFAMPGQGASVGTVDTAQRVEQLRILLGVEETFAIRGGAAMRLPFEYGGLWAYAHEGRTFTDDDLQTAALFADAVALGYTRFLDLQSAEDRARQAAIETAGERVRAAALAMQSTQDLPQVAGVLKQQLDELINPDGILTITYLDRETDECVGLSTAANPHACGLEWTSASVYEIDEHLVAYMETHSEGEDPDHVVSRVRKLWASGQPQTLGWDIPEEGFPWRDRRIGQMGIAPDDARRAGYDPVSQWQRVHTTRVPFSSGMVGYFLQDADDRLIPVLQELTDALDLGFVRFLDFKRLEEQNRRQSIETAAERVRGAAMAMESPEDLRNVSGVLFTEMRALGIETPGIRIAFRDPRTGEWQGYLTQRNPKTYGLQWTSPEVFEFSDEVITFPSDVDDNRDRLNSVRDDGQPVTRRVPFEPEFIVNFSRRRLGMSVEPSSPQVAEWAGEWDGTEMPFDYGVLSFQEREHNPEHTTVVQELTEALNLGFVRFLDFQRLEDQNTALEEANEAIQEANRLKSEFLANMSHELRTPMNAIVGFSKIIHRKAAAQLDKRQVDNLERVLQSAEILMSLINDILDLSKIEAGRLEVQPERFDLRDVLEGCVATVRPLAKTGVTFRTRLSRQLDPVYSDPGRVRQIAINLLSNAAKFTEAGEIRVGLRTVGEDRVAISVSDSGIGIPADKLEQIFEEFRQVDGTTTRKYGGTGLGLSISRKLAQMLGGDIEVDSVLGEGSTFTVTLPAEILSSQPATDDVEVASLTDPVAPHGRVVLSIDDDPNVISLITQELEEEGYQVVGAQRAIDGIEKAQKMQPHAITLDIMMPGMDGWEAISRLKANPETRDIPIIVVSIVDNKEMGYRLGADEYLIKPVDRESLGRVLQRYEGRGKQVLVTDDDPDVIDLTRQLLEDDGWTVRSAANGKEALEALADQKPDVMLLDLMMPVMDGFETLRRLRANPDTADLPVIVITAQDLAADELDDLRANASRVIEKDGLDRDRILRELRDAMRQVRE